MTFEFDEGANSGDTAIGPFLNWHAQETRDGAIPSRSFSVRDENGDRQDVTAKIKKGVVFDLGGTFKTGWCLSDGTPGIAPQWVWNDTPARFNVKRPADRGTESWKKGHSIRVVIGKDEPVLWSQAGAGSFAGLVNLVKAVRDYGGDGDGINCVIAAMTDVDTMTFKKGGTAAPVFTIKKWTDRPDCLMADAAEVPYAGDEDEGEAEDEF